MCRRRMADDDSFIGEELLKPLPKYESMALGRFDYGVIDDKILGRARWYYKKYGNGKHKERNKGKYNRHGVESIKGRELPIKLSRYNQQEIIDQKLS